MKEFLMETIDLHSLSTLRLNRAKEDLSIAKKLFLSKNYKACANRSYYVVFHSMRAVLAYDNIDRKKHSGLISEFRKLYIKTNIFSTEMSNTITSLFYIRTESDYNDFYIVSKKEIELQLKNAEHFFREIKKYLKNKSINQRNNKI